LVLRTVGPETLNMQSQNLTSRRSAFWLLMLSLVAILAIMAPKTAEFRNQTSSPSPFTSPLARVGSSDLAHAALNQMTPGRIAASYGKLPLAFEANPSQTDSRVRFLARGADYTLFLTSSEAVLVLKSGGHESRSVDGGESEWRTQRQLKRTNKDDRKKATDTILVMKLVGADPLAEVRGADELPGRSNYFIGGDPRKWRTNVTNYARVEYRGIYPGVDLVYYGVQGHLEYDFIVAPGTDPGVIRLAFGSGAGGYPASTPDSFLLASRALRLAENGDLVVKMRQTSVSFHKPVIYQPSASANFDTRIPIEGHYRLTADGRVSFGLGAYDRTKPLVIDPALGYSTLLGGTLDDAGAAIATDTAGNVYVAGSTCSTDFPVVSGFQGTFGGYTGTCSSSSLFGNIAGGDAFVIKLDPTLSTLLYSTYLGGGGDDAANGIAVNSSGNAFVTGSTCSSGSSAFPTTEGAYQTIYAGGFTPCTRDRGDAFVTELDASGSGLVYSTYLGGASGDTGTAIAVDASNDAYVIGTTCSSNYPATSGAFQTQYGGDGGECLHAPKGDVFVTKLNSAGSGLIYSTYIGGQLGDTGYALALDSANNAYLAGYTYSSDFPVTPGAYDTACKGCSQSLSQAFVAKLNPAGTALVYSTYLGGTNGHEPCAACATGIAVSRAGNAYVTGLTSYLDFPLLNAFQPLYGGGAHDQFVTELNSSGSTLVYSSFHGGKGDDGADAIALDRGGSAYIRGDTNSPNFPVTADAFQPTCGGGCQTGTYDVTLTVVGPSGSSLIYSTYLGGSAVDFGRANQSLVLDGEIKPGIYLTGFTNSANFPVTNHAYQRELAGGYDAFVTKFSSTSNVALSPLGLNFGSQTVGTSSVPQTITLTNVGEIAVHIYSIAVTGTDSGNFTENNTCGSGVAAGASCSITVTFTPSATGTRSAIVSVKDNGGSSPQKISLAGTGT
jgi:hypothetical protein